MSSLADKIINAQGGTNDRGSCGGITKAAPSIEKAQRFVFSQEAIGACFELSQSRPSSLLEALPMCRAPFQLMWLEWGHIPGRPFSSEWPDKSVDAKDFLPQRFGALIECIDDTHQRFGISFFWNFTSKKADGETVRYLEDRGEDCINICPMGVIVNWHDHWQPMDRLSALKPALSDSDLEKVICKSWPVAKFLGDQKERDAILKMDKSAVAAVVPHMRDFVDLLKKEQRFETIEKFIGASMRDISGEIKIIQAALCLMNSKNCVAMEKAKLSKINARRLKKKKKPLLSYSTVTINLSKIDQHFADSQNLSREEIRRHVVRGHFKLRKSGVYWWRPFLRGNIKIGQVIRTGYAIEGVPA